MADFAIDLLKLTSAQESVVISPFSIVAAMSVVERGAGGSTKSEITNALKRKSQEDVSKLLRHLATANGVTMEVATKLFLAQGVEIRNEYNEMIKREYGVTAERLDFKNQSLTVQIVNSFVSDATHKMIPSLLTNDYYSPETRAFLVNAVYFKGKWATCFSPDSTRKEIFYGIRGERQESFMKKNQLKGCRYTTQRGMQLLALPYMDKNYWFAIFLPTERNNFEEVRSNLTGEIMGEMLKSAGTASFGIDVTIPKFKLTSQPQMKHMLQCLGISQLFGHKCDLRGISEKETLYVDDVIHKAIVEVNEEGTEAAAVTGVSMVFMSCVVPLEPIIFRADHPFIYGIYCDEEPIFIGQYC